MFDKIAEDWSKKRAKPWKRFQVRFETWMKEIENTKKEHKNKNLCIDLGSGSGRHFNLFSRFFKRVIEYDISRPMLKYAPNNAIRIQGTLESLPFRENTFDASFAIASLHHIKGKKNREKVINEIKRTTKNGGIIIITVWRFFQRRFKKEFLNQLNCLSFLSEAQECKKMKNRKEEDEKNEIGDVYVKWKIRKDSSLSSLKLSKPKNTKAKEETIYRFYHLFRAQEFVKLTRTFQTLYRGCLDSDKKENFVVFAFNKK